MPSRFVACCNCGYGKIRRVDMELPVLQVIAARRRFFSIAAAAAAALVSGCSAQNNPVIAPTSTTTGASPSPKPSTGGTVTQTGTSATPTGAGIQQLHSDESRRADVAGAGGDAERALAGFGAEMLRRVHDGTAPNTALSPYSLVTVLAMARAGAKGATGEQLDTALELVGVDAQGAAITAIDDALAAAVATARGRKSEMIIEAANQTWVQTGFDVHQEYLDELARQFGVAAVAADFAADSEAARLAINAWVADRTRTLIPELFGSGSIDASTVLVLVNALYLKAAWAAPFTPNPSTTPFATAGGGSKPVTLMRAPSPVPGRKGNGWMSAYAGYVGQGLAMTILLPDDLDVTLAKLDADLIAEANATSGQYSFQMPGFEIHSTPDVQTAIKAMGVTDLFDANSVDLSGIAGGKGDLVATSLVHEAVVLVDENGTEAAAATGLGVSATGLPQLDGEIVVDKPFLFWIHDTATGAPIFLGVVGDPTATG